MDISEVRVKLIPNPHDRLKAFASVTLDGDFVVRDIKIIDGAAGIFVAMPSRKLADRCSKCKSKNHLRAKFCNECGESLAENRIVRDRRGRTKLHADIAHPINAECRQRLQERIVEAYGQEVVHSEEPGYHPVSDDDYDDTPDAMNDEVTDADTDLNVDERLQSDGRSEIEEMLLDRAADTNSFTEDDGCDEASAEESGSDYNSLIADLKRDAAGRTGSRSHGGQRSFSGSHRKRAGSKREQLDESSKPSAGQKRPRKAIEKPAAEAVTESAPEPVTESTAQPDDFGAGIV